MVSPLQSALANMIPLQSVLWSATSHIVAELIAQHTNTFVPTNYTVVPNMFIQDSENFDGNGYDYTSDSFGLIDKSEGRWSKFAAQIDALNAAADDLTAYKVIYFARHGEGYHNVAESVYGSAAWDCYWSKINTDGNITWGPDALLTAKGIQTSIRANAFFKEQTKQGLPLPQAFYSSPLRRAASTLNITWHDILIDQRGYEPMIKESLRERIGVHTCDKRSSKTVIRSGYPGYLFDDSFTENDELWTPSHMETDTQQQLRIRHFLDELFRHDNRTYISLTAHSGVVNAFFVAVNHRPFSLAPGAVVPVVVKAVGHVDATQTIIVSQSGGV